MYCCVRAQWRHGPDRYRDIFSDPKNDKSAKSAGAVELRSGARLAMAGGRLQNLHGIARAPYPARVVGGALQARGSGSEPAHPRLAGNGYAVMPARRSVLLVRNAYRHDRVHASKSPLQCLNKHFKFGLRRDYREFPVAREVWKG